MAADIPPHATIIAIPCLNEQGRIGTVVGACRSLGFAVWVIDDGSRDQTSAESRAAGARVIRHEQNLGKGMAIRTAIRAFAEADHRYLVFLDADGQHDPSFIPSFIKRAGESGADIVVGNRMLATAGMPLVRRWTNQFMSWVIGHLAGWPIPDSQCGYRLISRRFAQQFQPTTSRFDLESEMLIQAGRLGLKIDSIPIPTIYAGQASHIHPLADTLRFIRLIARYLA